MSKKKLGAIVVGTGFGIITHARALRGAGFDIQALVGRDPQRTEQRAKGADIPVATTSLDEALSLPDVDAVCIATPPHSHCDIALKSVAAGKHIVCEKPFARDSEQAQQMLDAANKAGIVHLLGTEFRYSTGQALATQAIHDGKVGTPKLATLMLQMPVLADGNTEVPAWWGDASEGGGWLGAYASHQIDFLRHLFGEFAGVSASLTTLSQHDWSADDTYSIHFRMQNGVEGVMQSSIATLGPPLSCFRIVGDQACLTMEGDKVMIGNGQQQTELTPDTELLNDEPVPPPADLLITAYDMLHSMGTDLSPYTKLFDHFAKQIRGEKTAGTIQASTFADGLALQKVQDAIRLSSNERRWVDID